MSPLIRWVGAAALTLASVALSSLSAADPPEDVVKLITQLKDPNEIVRLKAAKELGKLKERAEPALEALAKVAERAPDEDVRAVAKRSLLAIKEAVAEADKDKDKEAVEPFLKKLKSKKAADRQSALEELAKLGERARPATAAIAHAMMDASPPVREAAAGCMEKVDPKIHPYVVSMLYDESDSQKSASALQLGKMGARAKGAVPVLKYHYSSYAAKFKRSDTTTLGALVAIIPDDPQIVSEVLLLVSSPNVRYGRLEGLRLLDLVEATNKKKVEALMGTLSDTSYRVQVIEKLAKFGMDAKPALPALMKLKLDSSPSVRDAATKAIETITAE